MIAKYRVLVSAEGRSPSRHYFENLFATLGHDVLCSGPSTREVADLCRQLRPDLLTVKSEGPAWDGLRAAAHVVRDHPLPVILISDRYDPQTASGAAVGPVLAHLIEPLGPAQLAAAIEVVLRRFEEVADLRRQAAELRQSLADRKVIERAKGILMKKTGLDEGEAYLRLQRMSRDTHTSITQLAQSILTAEEACCRPSLSTPIGGDGRATLN